MIRNLEKERKTDRVLVIKPIEGKTPKNTMGFGDARVMSGENGVRAVMDPQTTLWEFRVRGAILHTPLRQKFTSFNALKEFADGYFGRRNLKIVEVKD